MKIKILVIFYLFFINSLVLANTKINDCDQIESKKEKVECLITLKAKLIKEKNEDKIEAVDKKIKKVQGFVKGSQKKINEFDEDNKTLLDVWKNFKK